MSRILQKNIFSECFPISKDFTYILVEDLREQESGHSWSQQSQEGVNDGSGLFSGSQGEDGVEWRPECPQEDGTDQTEDIRVIDGTLMFRMNLRRLKHNSGRSNSKESTKEVDNNGTSNISDTENVNDQELVKNRDWSLDESQKDVLDWRELANKSAIRDEHGSSGEVGLGNTEKNWNIFLNFGFVKIFNSILSFYLQKFVNFFFLFYQPVLKMFSLKLNF